MLHPEFPVVSFLSIPLLLASLPSHIRAGSVCTIGLLSWLVVMSLIRGINALIWADNFVIHFEAWCDITTKILIGFTYAVPASALCILRHLECVASTRCVYTSKEDKRRRQVFEAIMCFGIPMVFMALHYIVQGHRFDIIEDFGCYPSVYVSVAGLCLVYLPPIAMSLVTFVYAGMALHHILRRRIEFAAHLQNSKSFLTPGRYFRLMALAIVEMGWDTGVNAYIIYFNITLTGLRPWISWENVHSNFSRVGVFPTFLMPPEVITQLTWQWWIVPISCFCFFVFFAFGEEAMSDYRRVIMWFRRIILRHDIQKSKSVIITSILPMHSCSPSSYTKRMSFASSGSASEHDLKRCNISVTSVTDIAASPSPVDLQATPQLSSNTIERDSTPIATDGLPSSDGPCCSNSTAPIQCPSYITLNPSSKLSYVPAEDDYQVVNPSPTPTQAESEGFSGDVRRDHPPQFLSHTHRCFAPTSRLQLNSMRPSTPADSGMAFEAYIPPFVSHSYETLSSTQSISSTGVQDSPHSGRLPTLGGIRMTIDTNVV